MSPAGLEGKEGPAAGSLLYSVAREFIRESRLRKSKPLASLYSSFILNTTSRHNHLEHTKHEHESKGETQRIRTL